MNYGEVGHSYWGFIGIQPQNSECFHGNRKSKISYFPHQPLATFLCFPFATKSLKMFCSCFLFLSSHYLLGFSPLIPLKLFTPMAYTELKPAVGFQSSVYLTSQQPTIAISLIVSPLGSQNIHTLTTLVVLSQLLWLAASLLSSS